MLKTTSKKYRGRYAGRTYGQFARDAALAVPGGWLPGSLAWDGETLLDVVFERSGPVGSEPIEEPSRFDRLIWPTLSDHWSSIGTAALLIVAYAVLGFVVAVVVTGLLTH